jgi:hypothetical protein
MGFDLGHVVGDVVDLVEVKIGHLAGQHLLEAAADVKGQHLPVGKGVVGRRLHGGQVILPLGAAQGGADQLAVGQGQPVTAHRFLVELDIVGAHLVPQPPRAAVDLHHHLALKEPDAPRGILIHDALDDVDLDEVISGPESAHLALAPLPGARSDLGGIGSRQAAALLRALEVLWVGKAAPERPAGTVFQHVVQFARRQLDLSAPAHAAGAVGVKGGGQLVQVGLDSLQRQAAGEQPHPAVDVVADPAGGDDPVGQRRGDDPADGKPIALMDVGHGQRVAGDSRQACGVHQLLDAAVARQTFQQCFIGVEPRRHPHVRTIAGRQFVEELVDACKVPRADHPCGSSSSRRSGPNRRGGAHA